MWPFRRRREQTLNEMLLHEAGLDRAPSEPPVAPPAPDIVDPYAGTYPAQNVLGLWTRAMPRPSNFDAVVSVHAPGVRGPEVQFAALPSGDLIVDEEQGSDDLAPLAEAVERELKPPYRAVGQLQEGDVWAISAYRIDVLSFSFDAGDELELVSHDGKTQLTVDGTPSSGRVPELEQAGSAGGPDYAVYAERLDGDLWEVRAAQL
jgi:hypothetical protein